MAFCCFSGNYESGIAEFEKKSDLKELPKRMLKPREFAYAHCLHHSRGMFDGVALVDAGRKMLQANLQQNWLGHGQGIRAAMWLKLVYEQNSHSLDSLQIILKAYTDMPDVSRPAFVSIYG